MGRPKLDPALTKRIVDLVRAGNYAETAATTVGIHSTTYPGWKVQKYLKDGVAAPERRVSVHAARKPRIGRRIAGKFCGMPSAG